MSANDLSLRLLARLAAEPQTAATGRLRDWLVGLARANGWM